MLGLPVLYNKQDGINHESGHTHNRWWIPCAYWKAQVSEIEETLSSTINKLGSRTSFEAREEKRQLYGERTYLEETLVKRIVWKRSPLWDSRLHRSRSAFTVSTYSRGTSEQKQNPSDHQLLNNSWKMPHHNEVASTSVVEVPFSQ